MLSVTYHFPVFDFSELVREPVIAPIYQPLQPLQAGQLFPDLKLINKNGTWLSAKIRNYEGSVFTQQLLSKPLVISFYAEPWNRKGTYILKKLNAIQNEIVAADGNLLIITAEGPFKQAELNWKNEFNFNFYHDVRFLIMVNFQYLRFLCFYSLCMSRLQLYLQALILLLPHSTKDFLFPG